MPSKMSLIIIQKYQFQLNIIFISIASKYYILSYTMKERPWILDWGKFLKYTDRFQRPMEDVILKKVYSIKIHNINDYLHRYFPLFSLSIALFTFYLVNQNSL